MAIYTSKFTQQEIDDGIDKANGALPLSGGTLSKSYGKIDLLIDTADHRRSGICIKTPSDKVLAVLSSESTNPSYASHGYFELLGGDGISWVRFYKNYDSYIDGGNFGIGTKSPSYKLHVAGAVGATGYNNTSDIRKKDIIENLNLNVEDIANAPIFKFSWLDPEMPEGVNVGTSAQYWQTIIPEIVSEANDDEKTLSMQYGVAGLASSITLARKVVEQENTIKAQEARIKALEDAIAEIQNKLK